jgi:glycosyltransferase involved in cell wall biosynthesis
MKIAIFTNNYLPNPYGVSMSIESFRKELEKMGHKVYIFAPEFKGYVDQNPNVYRYPALDINFSGVRFPLAIPFSYKLSRILKNLEIDVVHAQHPNLLGWQARRWAKKKNVPLIFTWHTLYDQYAHFTPFIPSKIAAWWSISNAVAFANKSDQIIVPTQSIKTIIKNWGVKNSEIDAIASGVDAEMFKDSNREEVRIKYAVAEDEILLLLVSRLTNEKNVHFLFESVFNVLKKNQKIKFLIVGGGGEREALEKKIQENGLEKQAFFAGIVPAAKIKNYYAAADIFVHASKSETQGMILTEALFLGLPIVSVRATGAQDLVGNFVSGILVEEDKEKFALAVEKLAGDSELRKKYSQNAQGIARENYTSSICTQKLLEVYQKSLRKK